MAISIDVILCDHGQDVVRAWRRAFAAFPEVDIRLGDMLEVECDAYVSPANSNSTMDGGIDYALRMRFEGIEALVQDAISTVGTLLPVGQAVVVETGDLEIPYLVCAPTMEAPSYVGNTRNAFLAMSALLSAVDQFNAINPGEIASIAVPGLCTGIGAMEPLESASQMAHAFADWKARHA